MDFKNYLIDLDGTLYLGTEIIEGAVEFIQYLKDNCKNYVFLTNNSSKNSDSYAKKLTNLGIPCSPNEVFTSGEATALTLSLIKKNANVYVVGTSDLHSEISAAGLNIINGTNTAPDFVALGFDTTLTYEKIRTACDFIRNGVPFYATQPDINCLIEGNKLLPNCGAITDMFIASTGISPTIIGKPNLFIMDACFKKYGFKKGETLMIGDRLYTDIASGLKYGIKTALVLSGETTIEEYNASNYKADYVLESVKSIII